MEGVAASEGVEIEAVTTSAVSVMIEIVLVLSSDFIDSPYRGLGAHRLDASVKCENPEKYLEVSSLCSFYERDAKITQ